MYENMSTLATIIQITYWLDKFNESDQNKFIQTLQSPLKLPVDETTDTFDASALFYKFMTKQAVLSGDMIETCYNNCEALANNYKSQFIPNNPLSSLPVVAIAHLGTFLTKQETICLGYIDRTLYTATQTESFMVSRSRIKDTGTFRLTSTKIMKLCSLPWIKCGFTYCCPSQLELAHDYHVCPFIFGMSADVMMQNGWDPDDETPIKVKFKKQMQTIQSDHHKNRIFCNFFACLSMLTIKGDAMEYLSYLPVDCIFNKHITESIILRLDRPTDTINIFCANYKLYQNECTCENTEISSIRQIDSLEVKRDAQANYKQFIKCLKGNFKSLTLGSEDGLSTPTVQEINDFVLHPDLRSITLKYVKQSEAIQVLLSVRKLQSSLVTQNSGNYNSSQFLDKITLIKNENPSATLTWASHVHTKSSDGHEASLTITGQLFQFQQIKSAWDADNMSFNASPTTIVCKYVQISILDQHFDA